MECPQCSQELADQSECPNCVWKASPDAAPADTSAGELEIEPEGVTDVPPSEIHSPQAADSASTQPEPTLPPAHAAAASDPLQSQSSGSVSTKDTTLNAQGNNILIGQLNALFDKDTKVEERALYDFTSPLPTRTQRRYEVAGPELSAIVSRLKEDRLIFISCAYAEYALDAAYAAIKELAMAGSEHNRIISYEGIGDKKLTFSVQKLLENKPDTEGDSVVLVDALNSSAEVFPDSILGHSALADTIKQDLRAKNLFLVVVVNLAYVRKNERWRQQHRNFLYWEIPFLRYFLKKHFPDEHVRLAELVAGQRECGLWEKGELNFCQQVIDYHDDGRLRAVIEAGGPDDPEKSAGELLAGGGPVKKTVLYTAAFFQEITPSEFCRVVEALLDGRTARRNRSANGAGAGEAAQAEISLRRIWEEEKDELFDELLRDIYVDKDSVTVVSLSNSSLREPLRRQFERKHRFYVIDQFKILQEQGIFFYPSQRVAENTARLAVDMACRYPDEFSEGWVVGLIERLRQYFTDGGGDPMFQFLRPQPGGLNLALAQMSEVFRRMLESPQVKGMVQNSLEYFIKCGYHQETLLLINQLQFSPEFDELHWFKQLLHRADTETRRLTYYSLYSYLKRMGSGVYEGLRKVEEWLPKPERDPRTYSQVDYFILRLLIQYCLETISRFNPTNYGAWPSRYPLFVSSESGAAAERASLLARWLLHPGIQVTLNKLRMGSTQMTLIGALLAEWAFILLGSGGAAAPGKSDGQARNGHGPGGEPAEAGADAEYPAATLFDLLVIKFTSGTSLPQRLELLKYLNKLNYDLIRYMGASPPMSELKVQLKWKQELVGQLISRVKGATAANRTPVLST